MQITITYAQEEGGPRSGPVTVGWLRDPEAGGVLYEAPERVTFREASRAHAKSAARCPAVISLESRYFLIRAPFDLNLGFGRDKDGKPVLINRSGTASAIRANKLGEALRLVPEVEWRYPERPTLQLKLPYVFVADEPVFLTQLDSFAHYRRTPLPGTIFGGRFPIHVWPRPLMWAFEWHETEKDLVIKRGDPLFYCQFETDGPERAVALVEAERTPELEAYFAHIGGAVNYVNQTFALFRAAEEARPARLLTPKRG